MLWLQIYQQVIIRPIIIVRKLISEPLTYTTLRKRSFHNLRVSMELDGKCLFVAGGDLFFL